MENLILNIQTYNLPKQIIHGDFNYDNVLCTSESVAKDRDEDNDNVNDGDINEEVGEVTGVVDFEFCSLDWRAMELAVALSKYASQENPLHYFKPFIDGFFNNNNLILTDNEIEVLPNLIKLRLLSNIIYFVARVLAKEDTEATLTCRLGDYCHRIRWINQHSNVISDLIRNAMDIFNKRHIITSDI